MRLLCAEALPPEPSQRFAALFRARPRWALADLQPYIVDLQVDARLLSAAWAGLLSLPLTDQIVALLACPAEQRHACTRRCQAGQRRRSCSRMRA